MSKLSEKIEKRIEELWPVDVSSIPYSDIMNLHDAHADRRLGALTIATELWEEILRLRGALEKVKRFGVFHYDDCPKNTCSCDECECCNCGCVDLEQTVFETLAASIQRFGESKKGE